MSAYLSVVLRYFNKTAKQIIEILSVFNSYITSQFSQLNDIQKFRPSTLVLDIGAVLTELRFSRNKSLCLESGTSYTVIHIVTNMERLRKVCFKINSKEFERGDSFD